MISVTILVLVFFFFKQKTAYEMRISDWSSDVCSSDLRAPDRADGRGRAGQSAQPCRPSRRAHRPIWAATLSYGSTSVRPETDPSPGSMVPPDKRTAEPNRATKTLTASNRWLQSPFNARMRDRKRAGLGKSESVIGVLDGRRSTKKKTNY